MEKERAAALGFLATALLACATPPGNPAPGPAPARALLERLLPGRSDQFVLESIPAEDGRDVFEIESSAGRIILRGSSGVAIASGLNWYLKHHGHGHVSFCGDQLRLADPPPPVPGKIRRASPYQYRYCFNYCAFSYTMPFWDWPQWERVIDWMALHGINMPLAVTGQEAVWQKVYRDLGLGDDQIAKFLVGPAYLPFGWMGCIDGWGGPLPEAWIRSHEEIQKRILARERELGMTPVLQGFTGHVPEALKEVFPSARFQRLPSWCGFPGTWFLDPMDPLFERVGKAFIEEQTRLFGTDHLYASDTFIEMRPPSGDPAFLSAMGRAIHRAMEAGDPRAVWILQGWIFHFDRKFWQPPQTRALLGSVPDDRLILLDLICESSPVWKTTESFCGKPWAFCLLQSFGAQVSLHGGLSQMQKNLSQALASPQRGKLQGLGLTMEGFGYNPAAFDYLTDLAWHPEPPAVDSWIMDFARSRYGRLPEAAREAWDLLRQSIYRKPGQQDSIACHRPKTTLRKSAPSDAETVARACEKLLSCADELRDADPYRYDAVHLTRQVLANLAGPFYGDVLAAYDRKDRAALAEAGRRFLDLLRDLDELLATRREFLLGPWLADARRWAANDEERRLYEWNARNLITLWGPRDSTLHEYSQRQWSGMITGFCLPRWEMFLGRLDRALAEGKPLDTKALEDSLRDWEVEWTRRTDSFPAAPRGDPVATAKKMWEKYGRRAVRPPDAPSLTTGKPVSCSNALGPHPAHLANDGRAGDTDRYWATDVTEHPGDAWWRVDLEKPVTVGRVKIIFYYGDERTYGFTVEGSADGKTWETLADRRDNREPSTAAGLTCAFPPRALRYLKVTVTRNSANSGRHLVEVMAFEK
jgi:alpha-N-acetylglucosaminidase